MLNFSRQSHNGKVTDWKNVASGFRDYKGAPWIPTASGVIFTWGVKGTRGQKCCFCCPFGRPSTAKNAKIDFRGRQNVPAHEIKSNEQSILSYFFCPKDFKTVSISSLAQMEAPPQNFIPPILLQSTKNCSIVVFLITSSFQMSVEETHPTLRHHFSEQN